MDRATNSDRLSPAEVQVGDTVFAEDGPLGRIDRIIRAESRAPAYLVVVAGRRIRRRYPVVPSSLVTRVDRSRRRVHVLGRRGNIGRLSEQLPIIV